MMRMKTRRRRWECSSPPVTTTAIGRRNGGISRLAGRVGVAAPRTSMMASSLGLLCCAAVGAGGGGIIAGASSSTTAAFANPRSFARSTKIIAPPPDGVAGFAFSPPVSAGGVFSSTTAKPKTVVPATTTTMGTTTRLFGSLFNDPDPPNRKDNRNLLTKAVDAAKDVGSQILPSVFGTPEERRRTVELERRRRETRDEVTGGLSSILKDAPLPIRMMGKALAPILSNVAESFREQAREVEEVLEDARVLLVSDPVARDLLGEPITVGSPFSQSSSSMSVNGVTRSRVEASFEVFGPRSSGVATVTSSSGADGVSRIEGLRLNVGGRSISVDVRGAGAGGGSSGGRSSWIDVDATTGGRRGPSSSTGAGGRGNIIDADVIDAEYVEKKQKPRW